MSTTQLNPKDPGFWPGMREKLKNSPPQVKAPKKTKPAKK